MSIVAISLNVIIFHQLIWWTFSQEEYKILDKENRKIWNKSQNLYVKSQSLKEIIKMREKLINDMMTEIELLEREFENIYNNDKQKENQTAD